MIPAKPTPPTHLPNLQIRLQRLAAALARVRVARRVARVPPLPPPPLLKELSGLLSKGDTYSEAQEPAHAEFKDAHNLVLAALAKSGGGEVFVLDGPAAKSTLALLKAGVPRSRVRVANRHGATLGAIRGLTALPAAQLAGAAAAEALRPGGAFGDVAFSALYLDACGQSPGPLVDMIEAAFDREAMPARVALGFSLLGGGQDVADREMAVVRAAATAGRKHGMVVRHVGDEPGEFGVVLENKVHDGTLTCWLCLDKVVC